MPKPKKSNAQVQYPRSPTLLSDKKLDKVYAEAEKTIFKNQESTDKFVKSLKIWKADGKLTKNYR